MKWILIGAIAFNIFMMVEPHYIDDRPFFPTIDSFATGMPAGMKLPTLIQQTKVSAPIDNLYFVPTLRP